MEGTSENNCPICGNEMREDDNMYFCQYCGTNIEKRMKDVIPKKTPDVNN